MDNSLLSVYGRDFCMRYVMHRLNSEYWDKFKKMNKQGELVGDGLAFENLIEALLKAKYGISWNSTLKSHDNNRDFWLLL